MHIQKVESYGTLTSKYNHNYRIADVKNADKEKESLNEAIIRLPNRKTYNDVCRERNQRDCDSLFQVCFYKC